MTRGLVLGTRPGPGPLRRDDHLRRPPEPPDGSAPRPLRCACVPATTATTSRPVPPAEQRCPVHHHGSAPAPHRVVHTAAHGAALERVARRDAPRCRVPPGAEPAAEGLARAAVREDGHRVRHGVRRFGLRATTPLAASTSACSSHSHASWPHQHVSRAGFGHLAMVGMRSVDVSCAPTAASQRAPAGGRRGQGFGSSGPDRSRSRAVSGGLTARPRTGRPRRSIPRGRHSGGALCSTRRPRPSHAPSPRRL